MTIRKKSKISFLISLGLHLIILVITSPLIIKHLNEVDDKIPVLFFNVEPPERVKRRTMLEHQTTKPRLQIDSGSPAVSRAAPKYDPVMNPPKAPILNDRAPEIVTYADISQTSTFSLPNESFGKDSDAAGPVVIPEFRGAGGSKRGVGRGGSGTGKGGGMGNRLAGITNTDDIASIKLSGENAGLGIFDTDVLPGHGLVGEVYIPGNRIQRMPKFKNLKPMYTFSVSHLDVPTRNYVQGFPTPQKQHIFENFAIRFRGKLKINKSGKYFFRLFSDDGSKLYINDRLVIDNDGVHPPLYMSGYYPLTKGLHSIEIHYFQGPRHQIALRWFYQPPNGAIQIVPPEVIFPPGTNDDSDPLKTLKERLRKSSK